MELYHHFTTVPNTMCPITLPPHIKAWSKSKRLLWLLECVKPLVAHIFLPLPAPNQDNIRLAVVLGDEVVNLSLPPTFRGKTFQFQVGNLMVNVPIPPEPAVVVKSSDELNNSSWGFLRVMMDFMMLDDIVRCGDADRLNICLKRLIPTFIGLTSYRSKYFIELINFITKTDIVLSPQKGIAVKLQAFVNPSGEEGGNKAADMQQENNIKKIKQVLKGLGAGKTEKAMIRSSVSAPPITSMVDDFQRSLGIKDSDGEFHYHKKDDTMDKAATLAILRAAKPFSVIPGRSIHLDSAHPSVIHTVDKFALNSHMQTHMDRAINQVDLPLDIDLG